MDLSRRIRSLNNSAMPKNKIRLSKTKVKILMHQKRRKLQKSLLMKSVAMPVMSRLFFRVSKNLRIVPERLSVMNQRMANAMQKTKKSSESMGDGTMSTFFNV